MNTNLFHNIVNIVIAALAAITAFLIATGCTTLDTGTLECSQSWISPTWTTIAITALGVVKVLVNIARDGLTGLTKPQPPVEK